MAQQHTQAAGRGTSKPKPAPGLAFPLRPAEGAQIKFILAFVVLESDAALRKLEAMRDAEWQRAKWADTPTSRALSAAITELPLTIRKYALSAAHAGELLFCWHGTKATEVAE